MSWQQFKFRYGHAPDLTRTDPESWRFYNCTPYASGVGSSYTLVEIATTAMAGDFRRGAVTTTNEGTARYWYGTSSSLYEWEAASGTLGLVDRSGTAYTSGLTSTWSFAQFGERTLAVNRHHRLQQVTTGADFADANADAPKGNIVVTAGPSSVPFVIVGGYDDGTYTPDGWYCSPTPTSSWATSVANKIVKARLLVPTGPITAMIPFREGCIAFKKDSMWIGRFTGTDFIWEWKPIAYDIGCVGKGACVNAGDTLYFAGPRGFYVFDGSYPRLLPGYVHETWAGVMEGTAGIASYLDFITATFDPRFSVVSWHVTMNLEEGNGAHADYLNTAVNKNQLMYSYNIKSGLWTHNTVSTATDDSPSASSAVALISPWAGITGNKKPAVYTAATSTFPQGIMFTPRIGRPGQDVILKGLWPNWLEGNRFGIQYGPTLPSTDWQGTPVQHALYAFKGSGAVVQTTVTPVNNSEFARIEGRISGNWVQGATTFAGGDEPMVFDSVYLDLEQSGLGR